MGALTVGTVVNLSSVVGVSGRDRDGGGGGYGCWMRSALHNAQSSGRSAAAAIALPSAATVVETVGRQSCSMLDGGGKRSGRRSPSNQKKKSSNLTCRAAALAAVMEATTTREITVEEEVLKQLSTIIDPDFGTDIVSCGFVKELRIDEKSGKVSFNLELTTPACPVKDEFLQQSKDRVGAISWVKDVEVTLSAQPARNTSTPEDVPKGLQQVSNVVAVSSCKGGVGKSTVAVNLAYSLAGMGARVGIFDADIFGPSLPTMVSPEVRVLQMDAQTRQIIPTEYLGVKLVSFGFAGQGSAIMRGPMVSGVINQLLTTTEWGELDYLIVDMPPGTGDIQLTLCQVVPLTAAVIVTTPQKLAFIDVAKGVRMFSKLRVPCIAVVDNMCYFDGDDKRYYPYGKGSGADVVQQFGIPNLYELPIRPELSAAGDNGNPEVVNDPQGEVAGVFSEIGVCVVQQCAKLRQQVTTAVVYDKKARAIRVKVPGTEEDFLLHPATVRRNDRSAKSVDEWTGEQRLRYTDIAEDIEPESIQTIGNYAVSINWPDGFSQIAAYELLEQLERMVDVADDDDTEELKEDQPQLQLSQAQEANSGESTRASDSSARSILMHARSLSETKLKSV